METFEGKIVWNGVVEIFELEGHPQAERCYAWSFQRDGKIEPVAVLEILPVREARTAVQAYLVSQAQKLD